MIIGTELKTFNSGWERPQYIHLRLVYVVIMIIHFLFEYNTCSYNIIIIVYNMRGQQFYFSIKVKHKIEQSQQIS